ncbi:helix-turn-helix transcriptional regulator [Vulcaniibacterium gelatinicum]|uniref:helix-turn-helix transcriptional regulator n=1 Tax=Vulcaniibacterium gelatinicum TaxID=2598725 RepID=UPI0015F2BDA8|nr:helix-turn-helix transcriptional regulator [Vulcaniibacterium gelatinicum]
MSPQARIRLARRHAGLSQTQLAREVGVQRSAVSHWEARDGRNPSMAHLRRIAEVTGIQFEWLATGRGRMALSEDVALDSVAAAEALLVEDSLEMRLVRAFRDAPPPARIALVEIVEQLAALRTGRPPREPGARAHAPRTATHEGS